MEYTNSLKKSKYNIMIKHKYDDADVVICFNTFSSSVLFVENDAYERFSNNKYTINERERWFAGGFLVFDDFDEFDCIKEEYKKATSNADLALVICPTLGCNLRCAYCFEDTCETSYPNVFMSDAVANQLLEFSKNFNQKNLNITWYGGEPLLDIERIVFLQNEFRKIFQKVSSNMITNGTLLTQSVFKRLFDVGVTSFQITIDGLKSTHDNRRFNIAREGTFDNIIHNLREVGQNEENCKHIRIRVNVDKSNFDEFLNILDFFAKDDGLHRFLPNMYPAQLMDWPSLSDKWQQSCFNKVEFEKILEELSRITHEKYGKEILYLPGRKNLFCSALAQNHYVVGPSGELYKCWTGVGNPQNSIGTIFGFFSNKKEINFWQDWSPFDEQECTNCTFLPVCLGDCPAYRRSKKSKGDCKSRYGYINYLLKKAQINDRPEHYDIC